MAILLTAEQMRYTKASNPYQIKNPGQVTNQFTITEASEAAQTLKLNDREDINSLKTFLKGYDMTSISTDELRDVGRRLYKSEMISYRSFGMFIVGNGANDDNGRPTQTHVKFNAIALFNEKLEDTIAFFKSEPALSKSEGATDHLQGMVDANHAINALAYFVNSNSSNLAIDERA
ncbi:hypothetical protein ICY20_18375 [Pseudomonas sp. P115]|uniref:hypothetical protein n=1 Tax=Pseudomonas pisciculturae TaxID=2730413 RepID=UPI0018922A32|nr:hypothetical protein [Pseudomonas pisciculturae]MBF6029720.1 hypothetical protein [Pseudomonas pisciculturae]